MVHDCPSCESSVSCFVCSSHVLHVVRDLLASEIHTASGMNASDSFRYERGHGHDIFIMASREMTKDTHNKALLQDRPTFCLAYSASEIWQVLHTYGCEESYACAHVCACEKWHVWYAFVRRQVFALTAVV